MTAKITEIASIIEEIAPMKLAEDWDNIGLIIGDYNQDIKKILIALDISSEVVNEAKQLKADLIITHHPLIFSPIKKITQCSYTTKIAIELIKNNISVYTAHTNLDKSPFGTSYSLAKLLGLENTSYLKIDTTLRIFKYVVFVPEGYEEKIIDAIANAGGGIIGNYSHCSFMTSGTGTFKPLEGAKPTIGEVGNLEKVSENKIEAIVNENCINKVIESVKKVHPYEEVAYDVFPLENKDVRFGEGVKGELSTPITVEDFAVEIKKKLGLERLTVVGDLKKKVKKIGVYTGSSDGILRDSSLKFIDLLVTGDVKYHSAIKAKEEGLVIIDAGHYGTEKVVLPYLRDIISEKLKGKIAENNIFLSAIDSNPFIII